MFTSEIDKTDTVWGGGNQKSTTQEKNLPPQKIAKLIQL